MEFDINAAEKEYISDKNMSYKKLAEKYGVSYSAVSKAAKAGKWVLKRRASLLKAKAENASQGNKLYLLQKSSDKSIEALYSMVKDYDVLSINDLKNISSILKALTAIQRDLYDLPTLKEENSIRISNERLKLVRAKISSGETEDESETGVVLIPFLDEEEESEEIVYEGEEIV